MFSNTHLKIFLFIFFSNFVFIYSRLSKNTINLIEQKKITWPEPNEHGSIKVTEDGSTIFYWLFPSRGKPKTDPVYVWLTGGPGCSSELTIFVENGPMKINKETLKLSLNKFSWNNNANMIFQDQPVGTGLSVAKKDSDYATTEIQIAQNFYTFTNGFLKLYPEYINRDFYLMGESYAGHYIPNIADFMLDKMKEGNQDPQFNFKGISMGNPWSAPQVQNPAYLTYAVMNNQVSLEEYFNLKPAFEACGQLALDGISDEISGCQDIINTILVDKNGQRKFNIYDHTKPCPPEYDNCYDWHYQNHFFNESVTKAAEGFGPKKHWLDCEPTVYDKLTDKDGTTDVTKKLARIIDSGLKVLIYAGEKDFICNWVGVESVANNIDWPGRKNFNYAKYNSVGYGEKKCFNKLAFIKFKDAGHLVPMDQPETSLEMIDDFVNDKQYSNCDN